MSRYHDEERIKKLPQWAQDELRRSWANEAAADERALAATTPGDSNTAIASLSTEPERGLPPDSRIVFRLPNGDKIECGLRDGKVQVWGSEGLSFEPVCNNTASLVTRK